MRLRKGSVLYRIDIITTESVTVDVDTEKEAQEKAAKWVAERNAKHHHGERTKATIVHVPYRYVHDRR